MGEREPNERVDDRMRWEDGVVYALVLAGIYLLLGVLFFYVGKEKIIDGHGAPPPIAKQFSGTFLDTIPASTRPGRSSAFSSRRSSCSSSSA